MTFLLYIFAIYIIKNFTPLALRKTPRRSLEEEQVMQELALKEANKLDNFMQLFGRKFEQRIISYMLNEDAYIMRELMTDIKEMCEDASLPEPFINQTYKLKDRLKNKFGYRVGFRRIGKHQVVYKPACL